jgi:hypothetical protein
MNEPVQLFPEIDAPKDIDAFCAAHAEAIRVLARRTAADIVEIGQRLIAVKETKSHGQWYQWLREEFDWAEPTARNFMHVAEAFKSATVTDLPIDVGALYVLAAPAVPETIRDEAIELAEAGEHITKAKAEEMVADSRT